MQRWVSLDRCARRALAFTGRLLPFVPRPMQAANLGVVNIDSDGCAIMLWPSLGPAPVSFKNYWYDSTQVSAAAFAL